MKKIKALFGSKQLQQARTWAEFSQSKRPCECLQCSRDEREEDSTLERQNCHIPVQLLPNSTVRGSPCIPQRTNREGAAPGRTPLCWQEDLPRLSCINSPRLMSSQVGNFFPHKFNRFFSFAHLSLLSAVLAVFHLPHAMCSLTAFIPQTSKSFDIESNFAKRRFPREGPHRCLCF